MKLLLLQPPVQDFYDTAVRLQPIGLCYLKAAVRKHLPDVEVVVKDYHQGWGRRTIPLPAELSDLREYYPFPDESPFSSFHQYYHFGAPFDGLAEDVARERPDLVGISCLFTPYHREVQRCAEEIKRRVDVPVVVGGAHASAAPMTVLTNPSVDFVIRGEGERPLVELLEALRAHRSPESVPSLGHKTGSEPALNPIGANYPLEEIPPPDLSDLPAGRYRFEGSPQCMVIASRGCPHRCSFCSAHAVFGNRYRRRSAASIVEELRGRYAAGYRAFDFEDDNLTFDAGEAKELCRCLIAAFPGGDVRLTAMNGVSYQSLDSELLRLMRRAGFTDLNLSLVTLCAAERQRAARPHTAAKYSEVVREAAQLGFRIVSYQILGLPGDTLESMIDTLAYSARLPVLLGASPFYLVPGSPLADTVPPQTPTEMVRARLTTLGNDRCAIPRDAVYTLFVTTRILNFLKGLHQGRGVATLAEALESARRGGKRRALGAALLEGLLRGGPLWAFSAGTRHVLPRFRRELFLQVWDRTGRIATRDGGEILLSPSPIPPATAMGS